jgi:hypothetical protein
MIEDIEAKRIDGELDPNATVVIGKSAKKDKNGNVLHSTTQRMGSNWGIINADGTNYKVSEIDTFKINEIPGIQRLAPSSPRRRPPPPSPRRRPPPPSPRHQFALDEEGNWAPGAMDVEEPYIGSEASTLVPESGVSIGGVPSENDDAWPPSPYWGRDSLPDVPEEPVRRGPKLKPRPYGPQASSAKSRRIAQRSARPRAPPAAREASPVRYEPVATSRARRGPKPRQFYDPVKGKGWDGYDSRSDEEEMYGSGWRGFEQDNSYKGYVQDDFFY